MYTLLVETGVIRALQNLPPKIFRQLALKIFSLQQTPLPHDSKAIGPAYRVDSGEYRILYFVNHQEQAIRVVLVAKRNDDEVYGQFMRRFG